MIDVIIYQPAKSATQSGISNNRVWYVENRIPTTVNLEPLMGWRRQNNIGKRFKLKFKDLKSAVEYVKKQKMSYKIIVKKEKKKVIKSYADNFRYNRVKTEC